MARRVSQELPLPLGQRPVDVALVPGFGEGAVEGLEDGAFVPGLIEAKRDLGHGTEAYWIDSREPPSLIE